MKNNKLIRFVESFVFLPIITVSGMVGVIPNSGLAMVRASQVVFSQKQNILNPSIIALNDALDKEIQIIKIKADAIDSYFKDYDMPLHGYGMKMVQEAEKNNLDWRLLAAIAVRESTGGKHDCNRVSNNPFGWGSCKIGFKSIDEAIETIARNLGGNNPNTAHHYDDKTTMQILRAYNPPSVVKRYAEQVIAIMNKIGDVEVVIPEIS